MGEFGLPATTLNRSLDWQYTDTFTEAKNTSLLLCAASVKNLDAGKDWLEDSACCQHSFFFLVPLNPEICGYRRHRRIPKGQWIDWSVSKRQKGKPASLWFVKSNIEIKTCMAEFGRNVILNTQEEVHKHLRDNSVVFLFCFSIIHLPHKCRIETRDKWKWYTLHFRKHRRYLSPWAILVMLNHLGRWRIWQKADWAINSYWFPAHAEILSV